MSPTVLDVEDRLERAPSSCAPTGRRAASRLARWGFASAGPAAPRAQSPALRRITSLHTLGPPGTNCQLAARRWFDGAGRHGEVVLHPTLEDAADRVLEVAGAGLLACCAYPELHTLIYSHLDRLVMVDCLLVPTHHMVLARRRNAATAHSIALHPAPAALVPERFHRRVMVRSNSEAARRCADGFADACITTLPAALEEGLDVERDFGPVPLSFSVHVPAVQPSPDGPDPAYAGL